MTSPVSAMRVKSKLLRSLLSGLALFVLFVVTVIMPSVVYIVTNTLPFIQPWKAGYDMLYLVVGIFLFTIALVVFIWKFQNQIASGGRR